MLKEKDVRGEGEREKVKEHTKRREGELKREKGGEGTSKHNGYQRHMMKLQIDEKL